MFDPQERGASPTRVRRFRTQVSRPAACEALQVSIATTHHFVLTKWGGIIQVTAKDASDTASRDHIRMHLQHISDRPKETQPLGHYLRENFYITTSGNFRTQTLTEVMLEVGPDRILYSVDYPFEEMELAAEWFDHAAISEADRAKIGRGNSAQLFRM